MVPGGSSGADMPTCASVCRSHVSVFIGIGVCVCVCVSGKSVFVYLWEDGECGCGYGVLGRPCVVVEGSWGLQMIRADTKA